MKFLDAVWPLAFIVVISLHVMNAVEEKRYDHAAGLAFFFVAFFLYLILAELRKEK